MNRIELLKIAKPIPFNTDGVLLDDNVTGDVIAINFSEIKEIISID